jgi:ribosome biogenesis GTPase A
MVAGVPNGGKSTLINALAGGKRAQVGDKPGVTRGKQWVAIAEGLELLDTPGVLPPNIEDEASAANLAIIGSINDEIIDPAELALEICRFFAGNQGKFLARFKIKEINLATVLEDVARARGYVLKGGIYDIERTAKMIIDDFRKCRIGRIMLELPC